MQRTFSLDHSSTVTCPSGKTTKPVVYPKLLLHLWFHVGMKMFPEIIFDDCTYIFHYPELLPLHCPKFHHVQFSKPGFFCSHLFEHQLLQIEIERRHYRTALEHRKNCTYFQIAKGDKNQLFKLWISSAEIAVLNKTNDSSRSTPNPKKLSSYFHLDSNQVLRTVVNRCSENTTRKPGEQFTSEVSLIKHARTSSRAPKIIYYTQILCYII